MAPSNHQRDNITALPCVNAILSNTSAGNGNINCCKLPLPFTPVITVDMSHSNSPAARRRHAMSCALHTLHRHNIGGNVNVLGEEDDGVGPRLSGGDEPPWSDLIPNEVARRRACTLVLSHVMLTRIFMLDARDRMGGGRRSVGPSKSTHFPITISTQLTSWSAGTHTYALRAKKTYGHKNVTHTNKPQTLTNG